MKKLLLSVFALLACAFSAHAADYFKDGKPVTFTKGSVVELGTTMGGYPIYKGDGGWRLDGLESSMGGAFNEAVAINRGFADFVQFEPTGDWFASMWTTVNLNSGNPIQYFTGNPCAGNYIVAFNLANVKDDNCLTIEAKSGQLGSRSITYLQLKITQAKSSGRWYRLNLSLSAELLGFRETLPSDWNDGAYKAAPNRAEFIARLTTYGRLLQDATAKALDFSKPGDVFDSIPSYRTLLPVPTDLADGTFTQQFIGAVESTRYKPGYRAIAFTKHEGRVRWNNSYNSPTQANADDNALKDCNKEKPPAAMPCQLYDFGKPSEKKD